MSDANEFEIRPVPPPNGAIKPRGEGFWSQALRQAIRHADTGNGVHLPLERCSIESAVAAVSSERRRNADMYRGYLIRTRKSKSDGKVTGIVIYANKASKEEPST